MTDGSLIWLVIFALCGGLFFGIGIVVSVRGLEDLRDLLRSARSTSPPERPAASPNTGPAKRPEG
jgi:hypothetical protein